MVEDLMVRPERAAELLSMGRTRTYALIASGELRSVKIGRSRRFPISALREYVERLQSGAGDAP